MIQQFKFSIHGNTLRYRGEDVAVVLDPNVAPVDAFLAALGATADIDTDTLLRDIADLEQELDFLRLEAAKALKFVAVADLLMVTTILERIVADVD